MQRWATVLKSRMETGEPYIMYKDNVNKDNPIAYRLNNLDVTMTNICSEITLFTDEEHSFICCLSSYMVGNTFCGTSFWGGGSN